MKANIGSADKILRIVAAITIAVLYFTGQITGTAALILLVLAGVFLLTSVVGVCPLYIPLGISTRKKQE